MSASERYHQKLTQMKAARTNNLDQLTQTMGADSVFSSLMSTQGSAKEKQKNLLNILASLQDMPENMVKSTIESMGVGTFKQLNDTLVKSHDVDLWEYYNDMLQQVEVHLENRRKMENAKVEPLTGGASESKAKKKKRKKKKKTKPSNDEDDEYVTRKGNFSFVLEEKK